MKKLRTLLLPALVVLALVALPAAASVPVEPIAPHDVERSTKEALVPLVEEMLSELPAQELVEGNRARESIDDEALDSLVVREDLLSAAELPKPEKPHLGVIDFWLAAHQELGVCNSLGAPGIELVWLGDHVGRSYTGHYFDREANLYSTPSRYYDPETGRFISQDGIEYGNVQDPPSLHLYYYAYANPLRYVDLDGHEDAEAQDLANLRAQVVERSRKHPAVARALSRGGELLGRMDRRELERWRDAPLEGFRSPSQLANRKDAVVVKEAEVPLWDRTKAFAYGRYGGKAYEAGTESLAHASTALESKPTDEQMLVDVESATPDHYGQTRTEAIKESQKAVDKAKEATTEAAVATSNAAGDFTITRMVIEGVAYEVYVLGGKAIAYRATRAAERRALEAAEDEVVANLEKQMDEIAAKAVGAKKPYSDPRTRPKYAEGQVEDVWNNAKDAEGRVYDPNTGEALTWDRTVARRDQWDMGHVPGEEYRKLYKDYKEGKISLEEFKDAVRDPKKYMPEAPGPNRSRGFEEK